MPLTSDISQQNMKTTSISSCRFSHLWLGWSAGHFDTLGASRDQKFAQILLPRDKWQGWPYSYPHYNEQVEATRGPLGRQEERAGFPFWWSAQDALAGGTPARHHCNGPQGLAGHQQVGEGRSPITIVSLHHGQGQAHLHSHPCGQGPPLPVHYGHSYTDIYSLHTPQQSLRTTIEDIKPLLKEAIIASRRSPHTFARRPPKLHNDSPDRLTVKVQHWVINTTNPSPAVIILSSRHHPINHKTTISAREISSCKSPHAFVRRPPKSHDDLLDRPTVDVQRQDINTTNQSNGGSCIVI